MPKDFWKKGRERDHAKRAKREVATGELHSYEYVWESGSGSPERWPEDKRLPNISTHKVDSVTPTVDMCIQWLSASPPLARRAKEHLMTLRAHDHASVPILIDALLTSPKGHLQTIGDALQRIGFPAIRSLIERLSNGTLEERSRIEKVLAQIGEPSWPPILDKWLSKHSELSLKESALRILDAILEKRWRRVKDKDEHTNLGEGVVVERFLLQKLKCDSFDERMLAMSLLIAHKPAAVRTLRVLNKILRTAPQEAERRAAKKAIVAIKKNMSRK